MSAIFGIYYLNGRPASREDLQGAVNAMEQFATNGVHTAIQNQVAMGYCDNPYLDIAQYENLPLAQENILLVGDIRIDDRDHLCHQLQIDPQERTITPDSLLLLRAYQKWGESFPQHVIGDYAAAIWDETQKSMICVVDHAGVRPLYYYRDNEIFAWASSLVGLLALPGVDRQIYEPFVAAHLQLDGELVYGDQTFFRAIKRLPEAHQLIVNESRIIKKQYWVPPTGPTIKLASDDEYAEMMRDLLKQAVQDRLRTTKSVASHLSGGFDSTLLAVMASQVQTERNHSLILGTWSEPPDENEELTGDRARIEAIANELNTSVVYARKTSADFLKWWTLDIATNRSINDFFDRILIQSLQRQGVRLILSGWGGDETLSYRGAGYALAMLQNGDFRNAVMHLTARSNGKTQPIKWLSAIKNDVISPYYPDSVFKNRKPKSPPNTITFIQPDFLQRMTADLERIEAQQPIWRKHSDIKRTQLQSYSKGFISQRTVAWAETTGQHQMNYSFPYLDRRIMDVSYRLPVRLHYGKHDGQVFNRYLFRLIAAPFLPDDMTWLQHSQRSRGQVAVQYKGPALKEFFQKLPDWIDERWLTENNDWTDRHLLKIFLEGKRNPEWDQYAGRQFMLNKALQVTNVWFRHTQS